MNEREPADPIQPSERARVIVGGEIATERHALDLQEIESAIGRDGTLVWIDLVDPQQSRMEMLRQAFHLHPLTVPEVFAAHRTADVSFFDQSTHMVLHYPHRQGAVIRAREIQVVIGHGFLVTIHEREMLDTERVLDAWRATPAAWRSDPSSLLYAVCRLTVSAYGPVSDYLDEELNRLEEEAVAPRDGGTPSRQLLVRLFHVTELIADLHTMAAPLHETLRSVERNSEWFGSGHGNAYTRDVVDDGYHMARRLELMRETAQRLFDMVNALITLQRTDVSKQLTLVATIFLPLSFLGTYFGQNFQFLTEHVGTATQYLIWGVGAPLVSLAVILGVMWKVGGFR